MESRTLKVGFSAFVLQGGRTGVAAYVCALLQHLAKREGLTGEVLVPRCDAAVIPALPPSWRIVPFPSLWAKPICSIVWHNTVLPVLARRRHYDLVHVPSYRRIPVLKGVPTVATVHDLATFHIEAKYDRARMLFNRRLVPSMVRRADRVIAVSRFTRDDILRLIRYPAERLTVIYNGIDTERFHPLEPQTARQHVRERFGVEGPFIVYVSRLEHPAKNHVRLIQAFAAWKGRSGSPAKLVLPGSDWNGAASIHDAAAASACAQDILFPGFVAGADLPHLYSACELMVYPSLFEGFGFPILEALACGARVVCSNTSSMGELAGEVVPTFDPASEDAIRAAIEQALAQPWSAAAARRAVDYARSFTWENAAQQVHEVYRAATAGRG
jgi:glycosyltransferase involved in cell wall biosynthesis